MYWVVVILPRMAEVAPPPAPTTYCSTFMQIEKGPTSSKWTDTSFIRMRRKPAECQQSLLPAWAKCPCRGHSYLWRPQQGLILSVSAYLWESCCPMWRVLIFPGQSWFGGRAGVRWYLLPFLPSPSPRMSAHCARNNMKTASSPQRLQCPMDTDPPQEIRRRFGKKYACCAPKVYASLQQSIEWFRALCFTGR